MCPRPRPHRGPRRLQTVRTFARWDCINTRQREKAKEPRFSPSASLLTSPATCRPPPKCGAFRLQPLSSPLRQTACWREVDSNHRFLVRRSRFLLRKANCGGSNGGGLLKLFLCGLPMGSNPSPSSGESCANLLHAPKRAVSKQWLLNGGPMVQILVLPAASPLRTCVMGRLYRRSALARFPPRERLPEKDDCLGRPEPR